MTGSRRVRRGIAACLVAVALLAAGCGDDADDAAFDVADTAEAEADLRFVIPPGAGEALDRGEPLEILPGSLDVEVGDVIELINEDDRGHLVGPFFVGANETLRQEFASPGEFIGICTVHPSGEIVVTVT